MATITQDNRPYDVLVATNYFLDPVAALGYLPMSEASMGTLGTVADSGETWQTGTTTATGTSAFRLSTNERRPAAEVGQTWYGSVKVKNGAGGARQHVVSLRFYDTAGATLGTALATFSSSAITLAAGATQTVTVSGLAPASTASVQLFVTRQSGTGAATGDVLRTTQVLLSTDNVSFFYGATPGTTTYHYDFVSGSAGSPSRKLQRAANTDPITPTLVILGSFNVSRKSNAVVHDLLDDGDPAVTLAPASSLKGTFQFFFESQADADRAFDMHSNPSTFTLNEPTRLGTIKYVPQDDFTRRVEDTADHFVLEVPFREVG